MRNKLKFLIFILILINFSCVKKVDYLDKDYPKLIPKKYAQNIISIKDRFQESLTMSRDGVEILFTQTLSLNWIQERIIRVKGIDKSRDKIVYDTLHFVNNFKSFAEPMISLDNRRLFFIANNRCWYSNRTSSGDWLNPQCLDSVNRGIEYWYTRLINDELNDTVFYNIIKDRSLFNSERFHAFKNTIMPGCDPYISSDRDYMIFSSLKEGGFGQGDLCVCFNDGNGIWSKEFNLGPVINTEYFEYGPFISPDGKYLFFSRREKWKDSAFSDIYWVSIKIVDKFKKEWKIKTAHNN